MKKVLILSGINWNSTIQRHHIVASILAKNNYNIMFVEGIVSSSFSISKLLHRIKKRRKNSINNIVPVNIKIFNAQFVNPNYIFRKYNEKKAARLLKNIDKEYDLVICYIPVETTFMILDNISYKKLIYDCVRAFDVWGGYPKNLSYYEKKLTDDSDFIMTDSYYLTDKFLKKHKNVLQILPTISAEQYNILKNATVKERICHIIYFGDVSEHIDCGLLNHLVELDYVVHLFGSISVNTLDDRIIKHGFFSDLNDLAKQIVSIADAIIIPYKGNMDGVIPAKIMQCFASGLPIFISSFYDSRKFDDLLYVYNDVKELENKLKKYNYNDHLIRKNSMKELALNNLEGNSMERILMEEIEK